LAGDELEATPAWRRTALDEDHRYFEPGSERVGDVGDFLHGVQLVLEARGRRIDDVLGLLAQLLYSLLPDVVLPDDGADGGVVVRSEGQQLALDPAEKLLKLLLDTALYRID